MRALIWSNTFVRALKRTIKRQSALRQDIENALNLLAQNPFVSQLETPKLKGKLAGSWACSAGYDLRIIFDFVKNDEQKEDDIFLIEIGMHNEVS